MKKILQILSLGLIVFISSCTNPLSTLFGWYIDKVTYSDWSPDGKKLALIVSKENKRETVVLDLTNLNRKTIAYTNNTSETYSSLNWSPDSSKLTFIANDIYTVNANGSDLKGVNGKPDRSSISVWSPNGKKLAYVMNENNINNIFILNNGQSKKITNSTGGYIDSLIWASDNKLIFKLGKEIYSIDSDGNNLTQLFDNKEQINYSDLSLSPDGKKFLYSSYKDQESLIGTMNIDGTNVRYLTEKNNDGYSYSPKWSPDGSKILFISNESTFVRSISIMNSDGTDKKNLLFYKNDYSIPSWSPDSKKIVYSASILGGTDKVIASNLFIVNSDGTGNTLIPLNL